LPIATLDRGAVRAIVYTKSVDGRLYGDNAVVGRSLFIDAKKPWRYRAVLPGAAAVTSWVVGMTNRGKTADRQRIPEPRRTDVKKDHWRRG
jgi:hypothetical protein